MSKNTYLELIYTAHRYVTREAAADDNWDRDDTDADVHCESLTMHTKDGYDRIGVTWDVKSGDQLYALIAIYGTGDSFGHDGGQVEFVDVFLTDTDARAAKRALEDGEGKYYRQDGTVIKYSAPWDGYFESLTSLDAYCLTVD